MPMLDGLAVMLWSALSHWSATLPRALAGYVTLRWLGAL
jgi:hypothetical protein